MDIRFFRYPSPAPGAAEPQWPQWDADQEPGFALIALHRSSDPDASEHDGNDYLGGYGDGAAMEAWADAEGVDIIGTDELPKPPAFYPPPFATAPMRIRARWPDGTYRGDDPATPDINEAWTTP